MYREHIAQRLCVKPSAQTFCVEFSKQRHADAADNFINARISLGDFKTAGELRVRSGLRDKRRLNIQREMFGVSFERCLVFESGGQHANVSTRLRTANADAARRDQ